MENAEVTEKGKMREIAQLLSALFLLVVGCSGNHESLTPAPLPYYLNGTFRVHPTASLIAAATGPRNKGEQYRVSLFDFEGKHLYSRTTTRSTPMRIVWSSTGRSLFYLDEENRLLRFSLHEHAVRLELEEEVDLDESLRVFELIAHGEDLFVVGTTQIMVFSELDDFNIYRVEDKLFSGVEAHPILHDRVEDSGTIIDAVPIGKNDSRWILGSSCCLYAADLAKSTVEQIYSREGGDPLIVDFTYGAGIVFVLTSEPALWKLPLGKGNHVLSYMTPLPEQGRGIVLTDRNLVWIGHARKAAFSTTRNGNTEALDQMRYPDPNALASHENRVFLLGFDAKVYMYSPDSPQE
ncbi:MAG: hypothetical protein KDK23_15990 [Leptospiraceae bacterium]|nr:hypothetical protein [Leptospiraceae bacterium]